MDLMESNLFTPPIIVLQTVIEEVRHRSLPLYNRLKALLKADDKQTWVFYNEFRSCVTKNYKLRTSTEMMFVFCRETAVVREEDESPNDRNDRGAWYPICYAWH